MGILNNEYEVVKTKGKVITLHETLEKEIDEFLAGHKVYSEATSANYKSDLNWLARTMFGVDNYTKLNKRQLESQSVKGIIGFFRDAYNEGLASGSTLNRRISSLKGLIEHLVLFEDLQFDFVGLKSSLKPFPKKTITIEVLSNEDTDNCLEEFKKLKQGQEMYLLGKLACDTGLRLNELLTLEWKQFFKYDDKVILKSIGEIKGKGNKDWEKAISHGLYKEVSVLKSNGTKTVFTIPRSTVAYYMNITLEKLELNDKNYSFHSLRKNAVTNAYINSNNDIMVAKEFANHSSLVTTQGYVKTRKTEVLGRFSNKEVNKDLYKTASHEELLSAMSKLDEITLIQINRLLANNVESGNINTVEV